MEKSDGLYNMPNINRFEYIDDTGRVVVVYLDKDEKFTYSVQDNGKTLKLFRTRIYHNDNAG